MTAAQVAVSSFATSDARARAPRLLSIDVFRGMMVAGMVLVTNPGTYDYIYWPLKHADWNGSTPTDMIFPSFLFIVGVSMTFSFATRRARGETTSDAALHIVRRSAMLILLGLFLNCFDLLSLPHLRIPGVLQRIGLCYLCGGLLYLSIYGKGYGKRSTRRVATLIAAIILLPAVYWMLQTLVPVPGYGAGRLDQAGTLSAFIDRTVFTTRHLWAWGGPGQVWDPEGLLSTMPAIANLLLGILAGEWLRNLAPNTAKRRVLGMAITGALLMLTAVALNPLIPINKKIWTPSFMLLSGGFSLLTFAALHVSIDREGKTGQQAWRRITTPAVVFGSNAVLAFSLANMISPVLGLIHIHRAGGAAVGVPGLFFEWFHQFLNPWNASLAYAVLFVLVNLAILWPLYHRRIFFRL